MNTYGQLFTRCRRPYSEKKKVHGGTEGRHNVFSKEKRKGGDSVSGGKNIYQEKKKKFLKAETKAYRSRQNGRLNSAMKTRGERKGKKGPGLAATHSSSQAKNCRDAKNCTEIPKVGEMGM